jgi:dipeptidyl aminopeptidase/acylaminoacyl peptidase
MISGPFPRGHWMGGLAPEGWLHLAPGGRCRVVRDFIDQDDVLHPAGEEWTFLGSALLPFDEGRVLFVSLDGEQEWRIRLMDRPGEQARILKDPRGYVIVVSGPSEKGRTACD